MALRREGGLPFLALDPSFEFRPLQPVSWAARPQDFFLKPNLQQNAEAQMHFARVTRIERFRESVDELFINIL